MERNIRERWRLNKELPSGEQRRLTNGYTLARHWYDSYIPGRENLERDVELLGDRVAQFAVAHGRVPRLRAPVVVREDEEVRAA